MTYAVNVQGECKILKTETPQKLLEDWEDFKIKQLNPTTVSIKLSGRTPWYKDVVAKLYVLSQYFSGILKGKGEDGEPYKITLPTTHEDVLSASERTTWDPEFKVYQKHLKVDCFHSELEKIGFLDLYPSWLSKVKKEVRGRSFS